MKADSVLATIGNTAHIRLSRLFPDHDVWIKSERSNPGGSIKDRIALSMVEAAEASGELKPGGTIVEPTSGNTGIALAFVAAARGIPLTLTMPETMSIERRKVMKALGANIVLTEGPKGMQGAVDKANELVAAASGSAIILQQFNNPANPAIHEKTTGPEIWQDTEGKIDILVAGVGTGGTISGVSRYIKQQQGKAITSVAVEPIDSPLISQTKAGEAIKPGPHKIQGIGANFIPGNLDIDLVDEVEMVGNDEAMAMAHRLMAEEGILAGISSGAALVAGLRQAEKEENKDKCIVVILPDSGERYLTSPLFAGMFTD